MVGPVRAVRAEPVELGAVARKIATLNPHLSVDDPRQLPMKFRSLRGDRYGFFRGTPDLYYDWCRDACADWLANSENRLTLHGDVHYGNMGTYRTADSSSFVRFGMVDFDETFEGPFELDLLRGVVSLRLAAAAKTLTLSDAQAGAITERMCDAYADALVGRLSQATLPDRHKVVNALFNEIADADMRRFVARYGRPGDTSRFANVRFKKEKPADLLEPVSARRQSEFAAGWLDSIGRMSAPSRHLLRSLGGRDAGTEIDRSELLNGAIADMAQWTRVESSGSQGMDKVLLLVRDAMGVDAGPMIFEFKEQPVPAAQRVGLAPAACDRGHEVARAHALMQQGPQWFVSNASIGGKSYLVRCKDPWSEEPNWKDLESEKDFLSAADLLGEALGHAHRRALEAQSSNNKNVIAVIARRTLAGKKTIDRRAAQFEQRMTANYEQFTTDAAAIELADRADDLIKTLSRGQKP